MLIDKERPQLYTSVKHIAAAVVTAVYLPSCLFAQDLIVFI